MRNWAHVEFSSELFDLLSGCKLQDIPTFFFTTFRGRWRQSLGRSFCAEAILWRVWETCGTSRSIPATAPNFVCSSMTKLRHSDWWPDLRAFLAIGTLLLWLLSRLANFPLVTFDCELLHFLLYSTLQFRSPCQSPLALSADCSASIHNLDILALKIVNAYSKSQALDSLSKSEMAMIKVWCQGRNEINNKGGFLTSQRMPHSQLVSFPVGNNMGYKHGLTLFRTWFRGAKVFLESIVWSCFLMKSHFKTVNHDFSKLFLEVELDT